MKTPYYIYVTEDCAEQTKDIVSRIKSLGSDNSAVFIIGKSYDSEKLKTEFDYAFGKGYNIYLVIEEQTGFDDELGRKLGLLKKYGFDDESVKKLSMDLTLESITKEHRNPTWVRPAVIFGIIATVCALSIVIINCIRG